MLHKIVADPCFDTNIAHPRAGLAYLCNDNFINRLLRSHARGTGPEKTKADNTALIDSRELYVTIVGSKQRSHLIVKYCLDFLFQWLRHIDPKRMVRISC